MKLEDLSLELRSRVAKFRCDRIIEKHEGPEDWAYDLKDDYIEFMTIGRFSQLARRDHANVTIDRCIESKDGKTLTIFLHDRTYQTGDDPDMFAGRLAVCERAPEQAWFIAIVYHECWINRLESRR